MVFLFLAGVSWANAQEIPGFDPTFRSGDPRDGFLKDKGLKEPEVPVIIPGQTEKKEEAQEPVSLGPGIRIRVTAIHTTGNTAVSDDELKEITDPYLNRPLSSSDLETIRRELTRCYIEKGYVNSGAVLPDQTITGGEITYAIVEGRLSDVEITGNRWLKKDFFTKRISLSADVPLNMYDLEQRLQMLQQVRMVRRLHAQLKPGIKPGDGVLALAVVERSPVDVWLTVNNYQSPSVGAERGIITVTDRSLTGRGDELSASYGYSEGLNPMLDAAYRIPFTRWDTEFGIRYRKNDFDIIEDAFEPLDIESQSSIFELTLRQPFFRTPSREWAIGIIGEKLHSESTLLGEPFSFSAGSVDGESDVTALRFFQEYLYRSRSQALSLHSQFSWGLDALDATNNPKGVPDGRFFSWLGQCQWIGIFGNRGIQTLAKADIQLTPDPLLSLEQLSVGGRYSVRGYRENQLVRDNGVIASLEARIPLVHHAPWADYLHLAPFFDFGRGWNKGDSEKDKKSLSSVGIGLRGGLKIMTTPFPLKTDWEIYWGHPLNDVDNNGDDLQDDGFHFQVAFTAF